MRAPGEPDPIFAHETYGLGHTFAFTSDETDHWAGRWLSWPGYTQFWAQVLRWSLRGGRPADFQAFADLRSGSAVGHVVVDAFSQAGSYLNGASFSAAIATPSGSLRRIELDQTAPGRYEADFATGETGGYFITVQRDGAPEDGEALLGVAQSYPAEFAQGAPNLPLLREITDATGGRVFEDAGAAWSLRPDALPERNTLAPLFLICGLAVFILDIAWRRLGLRIQARRMVAPVSIAARAAAQAGGQVAAVARTVASERASAPDRRAMKQEQEDGALLARTAGERRIASGELDDAEDPFPLVASLDAMRRRERARERGSDRNLGG
jgi:hypothetical protein